MSSLNKSMTTLKKQKKASVKILGVIGDPISHSLSPLMHNSALAHLKLPYLYKPFQIKQSELEWFVGSLKTEHIMGFNVTIPHKENIIPFVDKLTPIAKKMGAVNTVYFRGNKLIGDNTDGRGYVLSLKKEAHFNCTKKCIVILGAGGAAKGIALALAELNPKQIILVNRTLDKAVTLQAKIKKHFKKVDVAVSDLSKLADLNWETVDLVINTTSVGLKTKGDFNIPFKQCHKKLLVSDIVYTPALTPFLKQAQKNGLKVHYGWGMLLYQGALAFELFTRKKAPVNVMKQTLLNELKI